MSEPIANQKKENAKFEWHVLEIKDVLKHLSTQQGGLSSDEASRRLTQYGPNELQAAHRISPWEILIEQFKNVLIIILIIATIFSAFLGEGLDAIVIAVIVVFAVGLGFIQEYRAERAIEALRQMAAPTAAVMRDGEEIEIPAREVVPGDIVLLRAGDKIPADARLVESVNLQVEEAALTGESVPVEKHAKPIANGGLAIADRKNLTYAGTAATYGRGRAVIVATGMDTEFGKIAQLLQTVESGRTPLQENLDKVGKNLARAAFVIVALIAAIGLFRGQPLIEMALFGIALAVAVVPEALPAVVTISLAIGVQRMVKRNALVRRLPAVETLGSTSVICSDKTGTLTKDEMTVRKIYVAGDLLNVSGAGYEPQGQFSVNGSSVEPSDLLKQLLLGAALASDARNVFNEEEKRWHIKGDPTEGALVVAAAKADLKKSEVDELYPRINEIPFTSETKRMTTLHKVNGHTVAYSKGAPEIIIESCTRQYTAGGETALDHDGKRRILDAAQSMAGEALRVLAVATREDTCIETAEHEMTFLGLLGMIDPPRPEAKSAIKRAKRRASKLL
jgi:P-type Ca2+ transporter type 2C